MTTFSVSSGGGLGFIGSGTTTGAYTGVLPVSWDFFINSSGGTSSNTLAYNLSFSLFNPVASTAGIVAIPNFSITGSVATNSNVEVKGTGAWNIDIGPGSQTYSIRVSVADQMNPVSFLQLRVPSNSIDLNPVPSGTPEPTSFLLGASALSGLLFFRRKTRVKS